MSTIFIATRGSALALAQASGVLAQCRQKFPKLAFELKIIKTTGDKLQTAAPAQAAALATRGLFTKELEAALLQRRADLAVHSLKDLPTDLPAGLALGGVAGEREDARDVLIYRVDSGLAPKMKLADLPKGWTVATGSARRKTQLLALRPDFTAVDIRGNVPTRLRKLAAEPKINATILAAAGLSRLLMRVSTSGLLQGKCVPDGLAALFLEPGQMLPCVGQGAVGLEIREQDDRMREICRHLDHFETSQCVTAERSFLRAMGGGCQTPLGAYACVTGGRIYLRAVAHLTEKVQRAEGKGLLSDAAALGELVAARLRKDGL
ncbi:MAG: hydroxymethylbilane synthase [Verrucomicrobiota bacterium]|jgi:hydroxymethylbilane synthase